MTRNFVRFDSATGLFRALVSREDHYPSPSPRSVGEGVLELDSDQYLQVMVKPSAWNYADGTVTKLLEGKLSLSSIVFYPSNENTVHEDNPELDYVVEIQPQFDGLPKDEPVKIRINNTVYELGNYGTPGRLTSEATGLFAVALADPRVIAEEMSFLVSCLAIPEVTDGN